jgi:hypothetical protein
MCALHLKHPPLRKSLILAQFLRQDWQVLGPDNVIAGIFIGRAG